MTSHLFRKFTICLFPFIHVIMTIAVNNIAIGIKNSLINIDEELTNELRPSKGLITTFPVL